MSDNLASKITDSELEVMKLLWHAKDALPVTEIREQLQGSKGWEPATIKTLISRLVSKGVVRQEKRNVYYYSPVITEEVLFISGCRGRQLLQFTKLVSITIATQFRRSAFCIF